MTDNTLPSWQAEHAGYGTMVRTALWLVQEVGVGNVFTKDQHRAAFVGVTQADRRMRDLRAHGWVIHTSAEDVSLNQNEQRLVSVGTAVWDPVARRPVGTPKLTHKQRMEVFARSDYMCNVCGIAGGELYPDFIGGSAVLSAVSRKTIRRDKKEIVTFQAECKRCSAGVSETVDDVPGLLSQLDQLATGPRLALVELILSGQKYNLPKLWLEFKKMSHFSQSEIIDALKSSFHQAADTTPDR